MTDRTHNQPEFSVTELSGLLKQTVEERFAHVRVRGEISGFKRAASGHLYFSLKDDKSVLNAIIWRGVSGRLTFAPEDGLEVVATGKISTYAGRSNYQIIIDSMEIAGEGALMALLEKRKKELAAKGLFDEARKKPLPFLPRKIGVVTSPTGAVIRDILHRLTDRFPVHVQVWPVLVQGEGAKEQIARAIRGFNRMPDKPDVLIVARGGGSLEDLWCFNEEEVVLAAAESDIPLISAVGHETDTTLIDYVADRRAPTPTAAAEMAVPVREELLALVYDLQSRKLSAMQKYLNDKRTFMAALARGIISPQSLLQNAIQRFDDYAERLSTGLPTVLEKKQQQLNLLLSSLKPQAILALCEQLSERLAVRSDRLQQALPLAIERKTQKLETVRSGLRPELLTRQIDQRRDALAYRGRLSPAATQQMMARKAEQLENLTKLLDSYHYQKILDRGFALVRSADGQLVTSASIAENQPELNVQFKDGTVKTFPQGSDPQGTLL